MSKKLVYIGSFYPEDLFEDITSQKLPPDYPAHRFQLSFLSGFLKLFDDYRVLSSPAIFPFPKYNKFLLHSRDFQFGKDNKKGRLIGCLNLPFIKLVSKALRIYFELKRIVRDASYKDSIVVIYSVHSAFLVPAVCALGKSHKICLIVPDLPQFMTEKKNLSYVIGKRIDFSIIKKCLKRIDSFVLFSEHMKEKLPIGGKPYIVMEGLYDSNKSAIDGKTNESIKAILYTGKALNRYGLGMLLDAFELMPSENYRLWIRGDGPVIERVLEMAKADKRIQYFGHLSDTELQKLQQEATILINPVSSQEEFTRYFFPSKTMEYLASGTPTVMCKLKCIPNDYNPYIFFIDDETPQGVKNVIEKVCDMSSKEREIFGAAATRFVLEHKNADSQAKRVYDFIQLI